MRQEYRKEVEEMRQEHKAAIVKSKKIDREGSVVTLDLLDRLVEASRKCESGKVSKSEHNQVDDESLDLTLKL